MSCRLTVAMIVRDEAKMAPAFLQAVAGLWDELVVVDTGSSDATVTLFSEAGARIFHTPWKDNFAAARNVSLAHATGDWVLILDADELITEDFISEFRAAIARPEIGALQVRMCSQLPYGHSREEWLLRAWRTCGPVQFQHPVCEDAGADVDLMLARSGLLLGQVSSPITHLGNVRDRAAAQDKKARDVALLQRRLAAEKCDFYSWLKLLGLAQFWNDSTLWRDTARRANDLLEDLGRQRVEDEPWSGDLVALIAEGLFAPESAVGLAFMDGWAARLRPSRAFLVRYGFFCEHQSRQDDATQAYRACLEAEPTSCHPDPAATAARLGLARIALAESDPTRALLHATKALECSPRDPEALLAVASVMRHLEGPAAFLAWLQRQEALVPSCPERDWAVGEALYSAGDPHGAIPFFRRAAGVPISGPAGLRLAQALLASGQFEASERLARQLLVREPEAGLGVLLFDLGAGRDTQLELDLTPETASAALRQWIDALLESRQLWLIRKIRSHVGALDETFPWLTDYLLKIA